MPMQTVEFDFPDEQDTKKRIDIEPSSAETMKAPKAKENDDEFEIEVVDDTPKADRGRKPSEPPAEVTDDELEEYSEKVRKRIQHFSKGYHDERRAKEQALREREELERVAQQLVEENKKLKETTSKNQTAMLDQAKKSAAAELEAAKRAYKEAYEAGDSDAVLAAQESLTNAKIKTDKLSNIRVPALQEDKTPVRMSQEPAPEQVRVDPRAAAWQQANTWFNQDPEMTSFALGLHNKLVRDGVDPRSDDYYERIDTRMRQVFPEQFDDVEEPKAKKPTNVVAPVTRSTAPKKIRLTQTQLVLAKRLGLTPEQYAKQVALDMRKKNG